MKVSEAMTRDVQIASPDERIQDVAKRMAENDIGFMPVGDHDRLVGMITDRDIVVRCVAAGKDGDARVRDAMTQDVKYCYEDEDMDHVVSNMGDIQVRRLPVVSRDKRLVGVVSLADAALAHDPEGVGVAMTGVVDPGGQHSQSAPR
ncbi:MAG: inosine-5-monophosphate dehydrogenase [Alphaproteobacteria bacterium]|nr:MAG: inosine-5-monophosphate dehydrogenase [Alphaproteobacteria bacterium]